MKFIPIIPCFNPPKEVIPLIEELINNKFKDIIVIDDGSSERKYIDKIDKYKECIIIKHKENMGKGAALKNGLKYYKEHFMDKYSGVVCVDCDGQHLVSDTIVVGNSMVKNNSFTIGVRDFSLDNVPFRSRFGNKMTSFIFKKLFGVYIRDTQTGLRAIPNKLIDAGINCDGDRYEYEINMLINMVKEDKNIKEEVINTVYIDNNKNSKFNPIKDSYLIYKEMFKHR